MTGPHVGLLYKGDGTFLDSARYTNESISGWQTVQFQTPVPILANTTYITATWLGNETFVFTNNYFNTAITNSPLHLLATGEDGANGVYTYNALPTFPSTSAGTISTNFWLDIVFSFTNPGTLPGHLHHHIYFQAR
jgi:hypothetical protein